MKITKLIYSLLIFIIILVLVYIVHINFFYVNVVLYSAILDGLIAAIISSLIIFYTKYFKIFSFFEKIQIFIIYFLIGYSFAITVPTVIDRSLSFYLLEKIKERGGGIKKSSFEELFTKEYMADHQLIKIRLTEQLKSGTIIIENNCVKITKWGEIMVFVSQNFRKNFLAKKRLILEQYTDELVNISKSKTPKDYDLNLYKCR